MEYSADIATLEKSFVEQKDVKPFVEKQLLFINDTNAGSYNGNITFDSTTFSNSGRFMDYSDGIITIPLALSMQSTIDITAVANAFMATLKSGHFNVIDSLQVDYMNRNVCQQQSFTNFYVHYKCMSEWSKDDLEKYGELCGLHPDTPGASTYQAAASARGIGLTNNHAFKNAASRLFTNAVPQVEVNDGLAKRIHKTAHYAAGNAAITTTAAQLNASGVDYFTNDGAAAAARVYTWYVLAVIRLKDVSDFFTKLPLVRGAQVRLTINYNAARLSIPVTGGAGAGVLGLPTVTQLAGRSVPFILASAEGNATDDQPGYGAIRGLGAQTLTMECNVRATVSPASAANPMMTSCRLYTPAYQLTPSMESEYLASPVKSVMYDDIYQYLVQVTAGSSFSSILTNGIIDPKQLVIVPVRAAASNANLTHYQSPYDGCPASTEPACFLTNFQVQVSGKNVFNNPVSYSFEEFQSEVAKSGRHGGQVVGASSGLISKFGWDTIHHYIVVDLDRRESGADNIPLAVQISGQNSSSAGVDLFCFIVYGRKLTLNVSEGQIVDM